MTSRPPTSPPGPAPLRAPRRRLFRPWWSVVAAILLIFAVVNAAEVSAYFLGTRGTGRIDRCVSGDSGDPHCIVEWTAGGESGYESIENLDGEPGSRIPIRVLGDNVVDGRVNADTVFTIGLTALVVLVALLILAVPLGLVALQARRRTRARRRMDGSGEQVLRVEDTVIRHRDGAPYAVLSVEHPGAGYPPSSCRIAVVSPAGRPYYIVHHGVEDLRRRETVVYGADGRLLAVVRRRLAGTQADVFGPDAVPPASAAPPPLATLVPSDRLGPVERVVTGPRAERLGTVLPGTDDHTPTLLGMLPGLPEPLRAGLLGFALTQWRLYPEPRLARADDDWHAGRGHMRTGEPPPAA